MSQEFERIVLEKLSNIEGTLNEHTGILNEHTKTLNEHTDILNEHTKTLNEHTGILSEHTKTLNEHTGILSEHTKTLSEHTGILNEHTEQFKKVRKDIYHANNKIIKIGSILEEMDLVIEYNTETIKNYKKENTKKIDLLLKAYEQQDSKLNINKHLISAIKSNNFQNDLRISALEDQIKNITNIA